MLAGRGVGGCESGRGERGAMGADGGSGEILNKVMVDPWSPVLCLNYGQPCKKN